MKIAKMVRILIILVAVLSLALFGCNGNITKPTGTAENPAEIISSDVEDSSSDYIQGTFTPSLYDSKWLNLRLKTPPGYEACTDVVKEYNKSAKGIEVVEMLVQKDNEAGKPSIMIIIKRENGANSLNQYAENYKKEVTEGLASLENEYLQVEQSWSEPTDYDFLGEKYLFYKHNSKVYMNGSLSNANHGWDLFREKGDYVIHIQCYGSDGEIKSLLSKFTTCDQNVAGYTVHTNTTSCADNSAEESVSHADNMDNHSSSIIGENTSGFLFIEDITHIQLVAITINDEETVFHLTHHPNEEDIDDKLTVEANGITYSTEDFRALYQMMMWMTQYTKTVEEPTGTPILEIILTRNGEDTPFVEMSFYAYSPSIYICVKETGDFYPVEARSVDLLIRQFGNYLSGEPVTRS